MKSKKNNIDLIQLRDDLFISKSSIDYVIKVKENPFTHTTYTDFIYIVYLKNCSVEWVQLNEEEFKKYLNIH